MGSDGYHGMLAAPRPSFSPLRQAGSWASNPDRCQIPRPGYRNRSPCKPHARAPFYYSDRLLAIWEEFYNFSRPHGAHGSQTPYEALKTVLG
jgi:hypothetical protein